MQRNIEWFDLLAFQPAVYRNIFLFFILTIHVTCELSTCHARQLQWTTLVALSLLYSIDTWHGLLIELRDTGKWRATMLCCPICLHWPKLKYFDQWQPECKHPLCETLPRNSKMPLRFYHYTLLSSSWVASIKTAVAFSDQYVQILLLSCPTCYIPNEVIVHLHIISRSNGGENDREEATFTALLLPSFLSTWILIIQCSKVTVTILIRTLFAFKVFFCKAHASRRTDKIMLYPSFSKQGQVSSSSVQQSSFLDIQHISAMARVKVVIVPLQSLFSVLFLQLGMGFKLHCIQFHSK